MSTDTFHGDTTDIPMSQEPTSPGSENSYVDLVKKINKHRLANRRKSNYQELSHELLAYATNTDMGNSLRMYARYGDRLHYVADWGIWIIWNGRQWKKDETSKIVELAKRTIGYIAQEVNAVKTDEKLDQAIAALTAQAKNSTPEELAELDKLKDERKMKDAFVKALTQWGKQSRSKGRLEAMIELLKSEPGISLLSESLDADDLLLNFPNGTLHLASMEFKKHNPFDLITKIVGCEYDQEASAPKWEEFIAKAMCHRPDLAAYVQKLCGMGLSGVKDADILPIHYGSGGNGKTVFMEMLKEALGDYAATANTELFLVRQGEHIQNDLARLAGVRFLTASETQDGKQLDESLVKQMTGGDKITARFLRQEFFSFTPKFTANLLTNHKPIIKGTDNGIWRRVKLIPWEHDFEKDITRLDKPVVMTMLRQELAGILNWCLAGYVARSREGLKEPFEVAQATAQYREDSDILGQFLQDECIVAPSNASVKIAKNQLYEAYKKYVEDAGHFAKSANRLSTDMVERGFGERRTGQARYWLGVRLRDASERGENASVAEDDLPPPIEPMYESVDVTLPGETAIVPQERITVGSTPLPPKRCFVCNGTEFRWNGARWVCKKCRPL